MKICIASGNPHKVQEIKAIISGLVHNQKLELYSIEGMDIPEPDEPYETFMDNACYKAHYYSNFTKAPTLSEDAGLCIEALESFPGVKTKDFLLECGGLNQAFNKLEQMLSGKDNYAAYFVCAASLYIPNQKRFITFEARDAGKISFPARGDKCFGFDPIFAPKGYDQTMAELGNDIKNVIGHRAVAMRGIIENLFDNTSIKTKI